MIISIPTFYISSFVLSGEILRQSEAGEESMVGKVRLYVFLDSLLPYEVSANDNTTPLIPWKHHFYCCKNLP